MLYDAKLRSTGPVSLLICTKLIGGTPGALDAANGNDIVPGARALVFDVNFGIFLYELKSGTSAATERLPQTILPDSNGGYMYWDMLSWLKCNSDSSMGAAKGTGT